MTDTLTVVIIASVVAACTSTLSGALQHYFQYVKSFVWVGFARTLDIYEVQFHQSKLNQSIGAIFDMLHQDSHCRSFTYKASSWGDGSQHDYIFLPTPNWKAFWLQLCMLGYYVYVPSDPKKTLSMLVTKEAAEALMIASNILDSNQALPPFVKKQLREVFHTDVPSKNVRALVRDLSALLRSKVRSVLDMIRCSHWIASEDSSEPLLLEQQSDVVVQTSPEPQQSSNVPDTYTLFLVANKYLDKLVKDREPAYPCGLYFEKEAPTLFVVNGTDPSYNFANIANHFAKQHVEDIIGLYLYDPGSSFHFSQVQELRDINKELYLILYLPFLENLEDSLPSELGGFEALARKQRGAILSGWTHFLQEISNSCFTYVALVMPALQSNAQSRILKYAQAVLNNRVICM